MNYVRAILSLGLFSWLSFAVLTGSFPGGDGGSSKTRWLKSMVDGATGQFGLVQTSAVLFAIGIALAFFFLIRQRLRA